jgi:hypothetical protein
VILTPSMPFADIKVACKRQGPNRTDVADPYLRRESNGRSSEPGPWRGHWSDVRPMSAAAAMAAIAA